MSKTQKSIDILGDNHSRGMYGKTYSVKALAKISKALSGDNNLRYGK